MKLIPLPASAYASMHSRNQKPELNWLAMKEKLGQILAYYNWLCDEDRKSNPFSEMKKLAVSMEATAKNILWMFMQKFSKGKTVKGAVKFTYSYLAAAVGKAYRAPAVITVTRHILRFLEMPNSFIKTKERTTLGIPGKDINCISITLDPKIIIYKNPLHQKAHEEGAEILMQPYIAPKASSLPPLNVVPFGKPTMDEVIESRVSHNASSLGGVIGSDIENYIKTQTD